MKTKYYTDIELAYKELVGPLSLYARKHLACKDHAFDAVHEAFTKTVIHANSNPTHKISSFILYRETIRACRRINKKYSGEQQYEENIVTDITEN